MGVINQVETAAIKEASGDKNKLFQRKLTALYTASSIEANENLDVVHAFGGGMEGSSDGSATMGLGAEVGFHSTTVSNYLLVVVQGSMSSGNGGNGMTGDNRVERGDISQRGEGLGLMSVDSTCGDVVYGHVDGDDVAGLEQALL